MARTDLPSPTDEDEFYLADLIGLAAVSPEGEPLGRVKAVHDFGPATSWRSTRARAAPPSCTLFTREAVPHVDIAAGRVTCAPLTEVADDDEPSPDHGDAGD